MACSFSLALSATHSFAGPHDPHSLDYRGYDAAIRSAVNQEWPDGPDWLWWKAQLFRESALDRFAVSPVGAKGLCQVMPATAADWARDWFPKNVWGEVSPFDARFCILGGARYMRQLQRFPDWRGWPDLLDRHRMAQASYNAGAGNLRKAMRACSATSWAGVAVCLPQITGKHAKETTDYVTRIAKTRRDLGALPPWLDVPCTWTDHRGGCGPNR